MAETHSTAQNTAPLPQTETIFLRVDGEFRQIQLAHLLYVSGMKDYVMFYMDDQPRPLITHLTMKAVEDMLPAAQFMRVNRSYIVALEKIRSVDRNDCIYIGKEIIRVTDAYREAFLAYINSKFPGGK
jgi:DNA-binding LytR/AlgR family response regulator